MQPREGLTPAEQEGRGDEGRGDVGAQADCPSSCHSTDVFICTSPIKMYKYCPYEKVSSLLGVGLVLCLFSVLPSVQRVRRADAQHPPGEGRGPSQRRLWRLGAPRTCLSSGHLPWPCQQLLSQRSPLAPV